MNNVCIILACAKLVNKIHNVSVGTPFLCLCCLWGTKNMYREYNKYPRHGFISIKKQ